MSNAASNGQLSRRRPALPGLLLVSVLALGGCAVSVTSVPAGPNSFRADLGQNGLTGSYDPAGFQPHEVQKALNQACAIPGSLVDYAEQPVAGGVAFSARCRGGTDVRLGPITVYRYGNRARVVLPGYVELDRMGERVKTISL